MLGSTLACLSRFFCSKLCCRSGTKEGTEWYNTNDFMPPVSRQPSQQPSSAPEASPRVFKYVTVVTGDVVATTVDNANNTNITPANNIFIPNTSLIGNNNNQTYVCQQQPQNNSSGGFTYPEINATFNNNNNSGNNADTNTEKQPSTIPTAPSNWELPQQQIVATRLLLVKPESLNNNNNISNVYPYLPSYSDAVNYK